MLFGPAEYVQSAAQSANGLKSLGNVDMPNGDSMNGFNSTLRAFGSERGFVGKLDVLNGRLEALGLETGEVGKAAHKLYTAVMVGAGAFQVYSGVQAALKAKRMWEAAQATSETTVAIAAQNYVGVALAAGAAVAVASGFAAGHYAAKSSDLTNPVERRKAISELGGQIYG